MNTKKKGLPSPSRVCKRSLCTKEDLTDNEHTRGREKDFPNDFSARKSSLFPGRIYIESVNDKTRALMMRSSRCVLFWRSIPFRCRPTFWFFCFWRFFYSNPKLYEPSFYRSGAKTINVDTPRRLPRRSRERAQKHFSEREYPEEYE